MKQAIKEKEFETINQIVDQKIALLDQEDMLITSGNKLLDSFINMKLEQLQLKKNHSYDDYFYSRYFLYPR